MGGLTTLLAPVDLQLRNRCPQALGEPIWQTYEYERMQPMRMRSRG